MNNQEFAALTRDMLIDAWGEKSYSQPMLGRLWRMVKDLPAGEFRSAVDQLSLTCHRAPSLGQIRAACLPAINRALEERKRQLTAELGAHTCVTCGGSGWVHAIPYDALHLEFAFICNKCESANVRGITTGRGASFWSDELETQYFVRRFTAKAAHEAYLLSRKLYEDVSAVRDAKALGGVSQTSTAQGWAHGLMQAVREGKSVRTLLQEPRGLPAED